LNNERHGAYWHNLTIGSVKVYRRPEDQYADYVRIKIWVDPLDDWDSGWLTIAAGDFSIQTHSLGGSPDDYVVYMEFKDNDVYGINQMFYGGADLGTNAQDGLSENDIVGAYWYSLTLTGMVVSRRLHDIYADQIRVRIFKRPTPTYDSGWTTINKDELKMFMHGVDGHVDDYVMDLQYKHPTWAIHHMFFGGNDLGNNNPLDTNENDRVGAYWTDVNPNTIYVYRRAEDPYAPEVRIRIWRVWNPTAPIYDSLWRDIAADTILGLNHNQSYAPEDGLLDLQFKSSTSGINQTYYGGCDFGSKTSAGAVDNDRTGAYWYNLSNTSVTIKRRVEDIYATQVRLRIWDMPKPDYNSGWVNLAQNASALLNHNLGEDEKDYLVDLQFKSPIYGINHIFYGGGDFGNNPPTGLNENDRMGAYWRKLDNTSIEILRRPEDIYAPQVRLRIWRISLPDYDSNFFYLNQDTTQEVTHNLGGNAQLYLVKMDQFSTGYGINHRHYGGADFGTKPPGSYSAEDRVGSYWRSLSSSTITTYRRPEDGYAEQIRVRIWRVPPYFSLYDIKEYLIGKKSLWDRKFIDADVNGDSYIDMADIIYYMETYGKSF
jgi:nicotinamide mononucleotide adenylyltransferase